jgi:hypothetical protein
VSPDSIAMHAPGSVTDDAAARPGQPVSRGTGWRVLLLAGRREAGWLARSPLVLAGLAITAWLVWLNNHVLSLPYNTYGLPQPLVWWGSDVSVVACMLAVAGAVLMAAQLAAGRARRDGMEQLYASYPASAAVRTGAQLLSVIGPVALAIAATAAAWAWVDSQGALGAPRLWVLAAGLLLVALAGTLGTALGSWLRHPMAAIVVVLVLGLIEIDLVLSFSNPIHLPDGTAWLFPWSAPGNVLTSLPGLTVPYPPPLHLAELAGLIAVAVVAALWPVLGRRRLVAGVALAALAVTCWSGWWEAKPVSATVLATMAREVTQPTQVEQCELLHGVRYCFYPAFAPLAAQWSVPVGAVLARVPRVSGRALTVRQVWDLGFLQPPLLSPTGLTSNGPPTTPLTTTVGNFQQALSTNPRLISGSSAPPVYTDANWGTGASLGPAQFTLALSTAQWATGLPTTGRAVSYNYSIPGGGGESGTAVLACLPAGQARASIALWLAAGATPLTRAAFRQAGFSAATQVGKKWFATVQEPGSGPSVGLTVTVQGAALAAEMLRLPERRVESVLAARWSYWLRPQASAAELAAALGLRLPRQPAQRPQLPYTKGNATYGNYTPPTQLCR